MLKDRYPLNLEYTSAVQVGRTVISFTVRNTAIDKQHVQHIDLPNPIKIEKQIFAIQQNHKEKGLGQANQEVEENEEDVEMEDVRNN